MDGGSHSSKFIAKHIENPQNNSKISKFSNLRMGTGVKQILPGGLCMMPGIFLL